MGFVDDLIGECSSDGTPWVSGQEFDMGNWNIFISGANCSVPDRFIPTLGGHGSRVR